MFQKMLQGGGGSDVEKYAIINIFTGNVGNLGTAYLKAQYNLFDKLKFTFSNGNTDMVDSSKIVIGENFKFNSVEAQLHEITESSFPFWTSGPNLTKVDGYKLATEEIE